MKKVDLSCSHKGKEDLNIVFGPYQDPKNVQGCMQDVLVGGRAVSCGISSRDMDNDYKCQRQQHRSFDSY